MNRQKMMLMRTITKTVSPALIIFAILILAGCDSDGNGDICITVTPATDYNLTGTAGSTDFTPASMSYQVTNNCSGSIELAVDEAVRWLDVDIAAFGGGSNESGMVTAGQTIEVVIEPVYGADNPERLDQLAPGSYGADVDFNDNTSDSGVTRGVSAAVN